MMLKSYFEKLRANNLIADDVIAKLQSYPVVVLWGTAAAARNAKKFLETYNIKINYVTDSFAHMEGEVWNGIPLCDKSKVFELKESVIVLIACSYGYHIDRLLESHEVHYEMFDTNLFEQGRESIDGFGLNAKNTILQSFDQIEKVYQLLEDEKSKEIFEKMLTYHITLERDLVKSVYDKNTYFGNDVISEFHGDTVVDCGAFTGDSMESFFQKGLTCKKYMALEPSDKVYKVLSRTVEKYPEHCIEVLPFAAWDRKEELHFTQSEGAASYVSEDGEVTIQADTIDALTEQDHVDLIKMDIEGAEIPALRGAVKTIQSTHPIVAASIYHHFTDYWQIPLLLKELYDGYKIYIRHHSLWGDDTVVYAIP